MSKAMLNAPIKPGGSESKRLDLIMAANVQNALATKVQELSGLFRKKQTAYLRRERRRLTSQSKMLTIITCLQS